MISKFRIWFILVATLLIVVTLDQAAFAGGIKCDGMYQIVNGQPVATPYCMDSNLAAIARQNGSKVSGRDVRNNPSTKVLLCWQFSHISRARRACAGYIPRGGGVR